MDELERELKQALKKIDPPPFFEAKILAAAGRQSRERRMAIRIRWAAAIAVVAMLVMGVSWQRARTETERGEAAKARLMLALKVTGAKLDEIRNKVDAQ